MPGNPMFSDSTPDYDPFLGTRVYNEAAFHQFLAADWARAERLRRCVLLILVSLRRESMHPVSLPKSAAASVFLGLSATVRDEDFIGWFREGRVAGALLMEGPEWPDPAAESTIRASVRRAIEARLHSTLAAGLRVRVRRLGVSSLR